GADQAQVPPLVNKSQADVTAALNSAGLQLNAVIGPAKNGVPPGTATAQDKQAGTMVDKGSTVTVTFTPAATAGSTPAAGGAGGAGGGSGSGGGSGGGGSGGGSGGASSGGGAAGGGAGGGGGSGGGGSGGGGLPAPPPPQLN